VRSGVIKRQNIFEYFAKSYHKILFENRLLNNKRISHGKFYKFELLSSVPGTNFTPKMKVLFTYERCIHSMSHLKRMINML